MAIDLTEALGLHREGQLDRAGQLYRAALAKEPDNADALHLLGLVALQQRQPRRALPLILRAVQARPSEAIFHSNLAETYWALGHQDRAIAHCQQALELDPGNASYHCNLGSILMARGDLASAIGLFEAAVRLDPGLFPAHNNLGNALRQRGQLGRALEHLERAVSLSPGSPEARSNLGIMLLEDGRPQQALEHSAEAVRLSPNSAIHHNNLGNVLHTLGRLEEAVASFRAAIGLDPNLAAAHAALGGSLENLGDFEGSAAAMREALRLDPDHADALARLATRLRGKLPEAERIAMARLLGSKTLAETKRWTLLFGWAQVLDNENRFEEAARASSEANALQYAGLVKKGRLFDLNAHHTFVSHLIREFGTTFFEKVRELGSSSARPMFVLGMPRSGTSLVEQILASHPSVFGAGELNLVRSTFQAIPGVMRRSDPSIECVRLLDERSISELAKRHLEALANIDATAHRVIDKMPENYLYLGLIAALFPKATVIHCRRELRDVALSCWFTHFAQVRWACRAGDIRARIGEYSRLMDHWRAELPIPMIEVDYEMMVADIEGTSRRLLSECGLEWHPSCLDFHKSLRPVQTASVMQVRTPIYSSSVGRSKNYDRWLPELLAQFG